MIHLAPLRSLVRDCPESCLQEEFWHQLPTQVVDQDLLPGFVEFVGFWSLFLCLGRLYQNIRMYMYMYYVYIYRHTHFVHAIMYKLINPLLCI